ncbi:glycosyltransferase, partial [Chloroflexota bacterium]
MTSQSISVLLLSHLYPNPVNPAFAVFVHEQVKQLHLQGIRITVMAPVPWWPPQFGFNSRWSNYAKVPERTQMDGVSIYYPRYFRPPGSWFRAWSGFAMYFGVKRLANRLHHHLHFNLIHSHTLFPAGHAGLLLGQQLDLPTICVLQG